jgi:CPA1 family monovalent cation:H+ antiporter
MPQSLAHYLNEIAHETPFELFLVFGFIIICSLMARRLKQPAVMGCFLGGFLIHFLAYFTGFDFTANLTLRPQVIMLLISLLIFNEGMHLDLEYLLINIQEILTLSLLGTLLATGICGFLLHQLLGFGWAVAIITGAMLMPTDAGAVLAVLNSLKVEIRWKSLISGESIFNDPFGLIIFGLALGVLSGEIINWGATISLILIGSPLLGIVLGFLFYLLYKKLDDPVSELMLSGMLFLAAHFGAEFLHMSEFLAVALASIFVGNKKQLCMNEETRETLDRVWEAVAIGVEGFLFLMIGKEIPIERLLHYLPLGLLAIALVVAARSLTVHLLLWILDRFFKQDIPFKWRLVVDLSGLHVGVTMAIMLTLPKTLPHAQNIKVMGYYVIIWSVLAMPLLMKFALQKMGLAEKAEKEGEQGQAKSL